MSSSSALISEYASKASSFAKENPMLIVSILFSFVSLVLALVAFFNARTLLKQGGQGMQKNPNIHNVVRANTGILVMTIFAILFGLYTIYKNRK